MANEITALVLCKDLLISSQLHGGIQRAGRKGRTCLSQEVCLQQLQAADIRYVILDLDFPGLDLAGLKAATPENCRLIAFAPHVQVEMMEMAEAAGCDFVLTRGQVTSQLDQLLIKLG